MKLGVVTVVVLIIFGFPLRVKSEPKSCPQFLPALSLELVEALPDYLNRTYTRLAVNRHVAVVSNPETLPLAIATVNKTINKTIDKTIDRIINKNLNSPEQLFITVKSGQIGQPKLQMDSYWLFLTKTRKQSWRLVMAFSKTGNAPPQDVSSGAIADAVRTWLGDRCP